MRLLTVVASITLIANCVEDNASSLDPDTSVDSDAGASADGAAIEPDMEQTPEPDVGGEDPEDACAEACDRVLACTAEVCERYDPASAGTVTAACLEACGRVGPFAAVVIGSETCADLVEFAGQNLGESYGEACGGAGTGDPDREWEECALFGEHFSECLIEQCPGAEPLAAHMPGAYESFCNDAVNAGQNPQDYQNIGSIPCDNPTLAQIVRNQYEPNEGDPDSGGLASLCADGPSPDVETCEVACEIIGPCIPDEADQGARSLRDRDRCIFSCAGADFVPDETWVCAAEAPACPAVFACFSGPEVDNCDVYARRVAACAAVACPGVADVQETLGRFLIDPCDAMVEEGVLTAEQVGAVTEETACDDPSVAALVTFLTVDTPEGEDDGGLEAVCEAPAQDPALCETACTNLAPCAPAEGNLAGLRDPAVCDYVCQTEADVPEQIWTCIRDAEMCDAALACIPMMGG